MNLKQRPASLNLAKEVEFLHLAENLKKELRHSWLSNQRRESVAEHCWRLSLMALRYADKLDEPVNIEKCLSFAIIHDLPEAMTGDIPVFECHLPTSKQKKLAAEAEAMLTIKNNLNDTQAELVYQLWLDYEKQACYESRYIKALDKIEAFTQHNEAPLSTWEEREKLMLFQPKWLIKYCQFDSFLLSLAEFTLQQSIEKLIAGGENIQQLKLLALADEEKVSP